MAMPVKLDHCPRDVGCTSQIVWRDPDDMKLYSTRVDRITGIPNFVPHVCTAKNAELPKIVFSGTWRNARTGFVRITGPFRLERSALRPPVDSKKNMATEWEFVSLSQGSMTWEPVEIPELFKDEFFSTFNKYTPKEDANEA